MSINNKDDDDDGRQDKKKKGKKKGNMPSQYFLFSSGLLFIKLNTSASRQVHSR